MIVLAQSPGLLASIYKQQTYWCSGGVCFAIQTFIKENKKDISELAALQEGLRAQQSAALTKLRQQLLACLRNQRKAASDELWDLEQRERNRIGEDLEEQTTQLQEACTKLDE